MKHKKLLAVALATGAVSSLLCYASVVQANGLAVITTGGVNQQNLIYADLSAATTTETYTLPKVKKTGEILMVVTHGATDSLILLELIPAAGDTINTDENVKDLDPGTAHMILAGDKEHHTWWVVSRGNQ